MTIQGTPYIICAVRGGPESRAAVTRAIDIALDMEARLVFFHVTDAEFLDYATVAPLSVVYKELKEMSAFALLVLCDRARRRGVRDVEYVIREGNIRKQLRQAAIETRAKVMVMGRPVRSPGSNVFKPEEFDIFVRELETSGDLRIIQVSQPQEE